MHCTCIEVPNGAELNMFQNKKYYIRFLQKLFRPCDGKPLEGRMKRKVCECYLSLELFVKLYLDFDVVPLKIKLQSENL